MRKLLTVASIFLFAAGMAVAQDTNQSSTTSSAQQPSMTDNHLRGCLTAGGDQFKLTTDIGAKVVNLQVDKTTASPYVAHEVEVQGTSNSDGSFRVDKINDIDDHCGHSGQPTTASSDFKASSEAPATSTSAASTTANPDQSAVAQNQAATPATAQSSTTTSTDMTAQNQQQPATSTSSTSSTVTTPSTQPVPDSNAAVATEQKPSTTQSATTTTTTEQNAAPATSAQAEKPAADQSAAAPAEQKSEKSELPQTASPLPLLGLLGLGSVAAGLISRKRK